MTSQTVLIAHNIRSSHNVGSLLRTAEGLGVAKVYLTGYTPRPLANNDNRLPHLAVKQTRQISKTALGAEALVDWHYQEDILKAINTLKSDGFVIAALEQTAIAQSLNTFKASPKTALIVGNEVFGIDARTLSMADIHLYLPMHGRKESFNVSVAAAIALYHIKLKGDGQID